MPMITGTKLTPSMSSSRPKVKRGMPRTGSRPTIAIRRPSTPIISALIRDLPARPMTRERPTVNRAKDSTGPNCSAILVRGTAARIRQIVANSPPMKLPIAASDSAVPALPCLASS